MVGVEILQKDEPYYIPGYTGFCPQHKFVCGENYGQITSGHLVDASINHADKLVLTDRFKTHELTKPTRANIKMVNSRSERTDPVYSYPIVPSYKGFVPNQGDIRDKPFEVQAIQGIADFERQYLQRKDSLERLRTVIDLQSGHRQPRNLEERLLLKSKFKLPLIAVRPERAGIQRCRPVTEKYMKPEDYSTSPYFMDNHNSKKYFINGYTGHAPYRAVHIGKPYRKMTADGLKDFTSNYLPRKRVEYAPIDIIKRKQGAARIDDTSGQIYIKDTPIMPTYTGHIPGAKDEIGKTRGYCSKLAHHFLEEHLFKLDMNDCEISL